MKHQYLITRAQIGRIEEVMHDTSRRHRATLDITRRLSKAKRDWVKKIIDDINADMDTVFEILKYIKKRSRHGNKINRRARRRTAGMEQA